MDRHEETKRTDQGEFGTALDAGAVTAGGKTCRAGELEWKAHPVYPGVALKHLLTGADTGGDYSLHLVRVDPGRAIEEHVHPDRRELHVVASGDGDCRAGDLRLAYAPGCCADIPAGQVHRVQAGPAGLVLLATFVPALV